MEIAMREYLPVAIGIAAMLLAGPVLAKKRSPLEAATVKAASDCVAAAALNNPKITRSVPAEQAQIGH